MRHLLRANRRVLAFGAGVALLLPFQNCGSFRANTATQALTAQCRATYANEALRRVMSEPRALACAEPASYLCERRVFAPGAGSALTQSTECLGHDGFCVGVTTRHFDTAPARERGNEAAFVRGGDYNHVEARCYHRWTFRGQSVIENEAADLATALANVHQACQSAQGEIR